MAGLELPWSRATDLDGVLDEMLAELFDRLPDLDPADVDVEEALLAACAVVASSTRTLLVDRVLADYRRFGEVVHDVSPIEGSAATAETTWTLRDTGAQVTIPAGTQVGWPGPGGETLFELDSEISVSAGTTEVTGVLIRAVKDGTEPVEGLELAELTLVDRLSAVRKVEATSLPSGAVDEESAGEFEERLAERVKLWGETLVTPEDMRAAAEQQPEVGRALALDGYDPTYNRLTANQSSLETDTSGWNAGANTAIARDTSQAREGSASLRLDDQTTDAVATDISAFTDGGANGAPVREEQTVTALASALDNGTARSFHVTVAFYDSGGALLSSTNGSSVAQNAGQWTQASVTATAPAGTETARLRVTIEGVADGESHYVDAASLHHGSHTDWEEGGSDGHDRTLVVTVALADDDGKELAKGTRDDIESRLNDPEWRAANRVTHTIDPYYTQVVVEAGVFVESGYDASTVLERARQAVYDFLHPARWSWSDTVERDEVFYRLRDAEGVSDVENLTINGSAGDAALDGIAPLPTHRDDPNNPTTVTLTQA